MRTVKVVLYWLTLIPPIIDAVKGIIVGIQKGIEDVRRKHDIEQQEAFERANSGSSDVN